MVAKERKLSKGAPGKPGAPPGEAADSRLTSIADWMRNEKKSGLTTKEAVQYEKVRPRCTTAPARASLRWAPRARWPAQQELPPSTTPAAVARGRRPPHSG